MSRVIRTFKCGHWREFPRTSAPALRDAVFCIQCADDTYVVGKDPEEWHAKCIHLGRDKACGFGKWTGKGGRELAIRAAVQHRRKHPAHAIKVFDPMGNLWRTFDGGGQISIADYGASVSDSASGNKCF